MPNWCVNELEIIGSDEDIESLLASALDADGEAPLSLARLVPVPPLGSDAAYAWRVTHWGTKWDVVDSDVYTDHLPGRVRLQFLTAWSPPSAVIETVAERWPALRLVLSYEESGNDFAGQTVFEDGRVAEVRSGSYRDICNPVDEDAADEDEIVWEVRGALTDVCAELPLSRQHLTLGRLADAIEAAGASGGAFPADVLTDWVGSIFAIDEAGEQGDPLDGLVFVTAMSGHRRLASALVPYLGLNSAITLAKQASNAMSGSGGVIRELARSSDPAIRAVGRLYLHLGTTLNADGQTLWAQSIKVNPALEELLGVALAAGRSDEWVETVIGLQHEWSDSEVDGLLRAAWALLN